jgi:hypothetical protein
MKTYTQKLWFDKTITWRVKYQFVECIAYSITYAMIVYYKQAPEMNQKQ